MTKEAREMKELIQETRETTRDEGGDEDEAKTMTTRWRQRRTIGTMEETKRRRREMIETMGKLRR